MMVHGIDKRGNFLVFFSLFSTILSMPWSSCIFTHQTHRHSTGFNLEGYCYQIFQFSSSTTLVQLVEQLDKKPDILQCSIPANCNFFNFKFSSSFDALTQCWYVYTDFDTNSHNHCGLVALFVSQLRLVTWIQFLSSQSVPRGPLEY